MLASRMGLLGGSLALMLLPQASTVAIGQDANGGPPPTQGRDQAVELAMKIKQPFTFVAVGDLLQTLPFSRTNDPRSQFLFNIIRQADAAMANNEVTIVDPDSFRGHMPAMVASPAVADDWKNMGIDIVTRANNHTWDAGEDGLWQDFHELDRVGIQHVGVGINLTEARLAGFYQTPKGQVAAIGVYTQNDLQRIDRSAPPVRVSAAQLSQLRAIRDSIVARGREVENPLPVQAPDPDGMASLFGLEFSSRTDVPGVPRSAATESARGAIKSQANVLDLKTYNGVTRSQFNQLKSIAGDQGKLEGDSLAAWGKFFRVAAGPGEFHYDMDPQEERDILREVRSGKQMAGFMAVAIHWHQNRYAFQHYSFDHYPADYEIKFAHDCIDQGADIFTGHGVHTIKGIEIYKGKPIFYGLSNFFLTVMDFRSWRDSGATRKPTPLDGAILGDGEENESRWNWLQQPDNQEALLTQTRYDHGKLVEVRIYPVDLGDLAGGMQGWTRPGAEIGVPRKPSPAKAKDILTRLQKYSAPFGTKIDIENSVGVIRIP